MRAATVAAVCQLKGKIASGAQLDPSPFVSSEVEKRTGRTQAFLDFARNER